MISRQIGVVGVFGVVGAPPLPNSEGWRGGCGEMSGGLEIVFYFHVVCASPPFLCAGVAPRDKTIRRENAREFSGGLVRDHARLKEHQKSQAKQQRKPTNTKIHRF